MTDYKEKFEKMRIAGNLAAKTLDMLTENIKEGVSTSSIDKLGYEFIRDNGGHSAPLFYRGFEKSLCTSLNHVVCHGIPSEDRILQDGDAVTIPEFLNQVYVFGEIPNQGSVRFEEGLSIKDYIQMKGGFESKADKKGVFILFLKILLLCQLFLLLLYIAYIIC